MKKFALALGIILLPVAAPSAHAATGRSVRSTPVLGADCTMRVVEDGAYHPTWTGIAALVHLTPVGWSETVSCELRINGWSLGTVVPETSGQGILHNAAPLSFGARLSDVVTLCAHVTSNYGNTMVTCYDATTNPAETGQYVAITDPSGICGLAVANDVTPYGLIGGPYAWNGAVWVEHQSPPTPVWCELFLDGVSQGEIQHGLWLQTSDAGHVRDVAYTQFYATPSTIVTICAHVGDYWTDSVACYDWSTTSVPDPDPLLSPLSPLCEPFWTVAPSVNALNRGIYIDPTSGNIWIYLAGRWVSYHCVL